MVTHHTKYNSHFRIPNTQARYAIADLDNLSVHSAIDKIVVPEARNFESADAFRVSSTCILQQAPVTPPAVHYETLEFQMTVGESHQTKLNGVTTVVEKVMKDLLNTDVTYVFVVVVVVPDDVKHFYKTPHRDFNDDNQYWLVIDDNKVN